MDGLEIALIALGIVPCSLALVFSLYKMCVPAARSKRGLQEHTSPFPIPDEVPWKKIGGSSIELARGSALTQPMHVDEPVFKTLRADLEKIGDAKWRLRIRFVFLNTLNETLAVDDMHTRLYEKELPGYYPATIGYRKDVLLLEDNTIWKDEKSYSLGPGDGYELVLVLEITRMAGSEGYGTFRESAGPVSTVFGLLVDYYCATTTSGLERRALPSDCIYVFEAEDDSAEFRAIDSETIRELVSRYKTDQNAMKRLERLETLLADHLAFRPVPKP